MVNSVETSSQRRIHLKEAVMSFLYESSTYWAWGGYRLQRQPWTLSASLNLKFRQAIKMYLLY